MRSTTFALATASALLSVANAASAVDWKSRSIYQVMIDRFAVTDDATATDCADLSQHCGGSWLGLINHLDYIQSKSSPSNHTKIGGFFSVSRRKQR